MKIKMGCTENISGWDIGGLSRDVVPVTRTIDDAVDAVLDITCL